jgi:hypothetical protein
MVSDSSDNVSSGFVVKGISNEFKNRSDQVFCLLSSSAASIENPIKLPTESNTSPCRLSPPPEAMDSEVLDSEGFKVPRDPSSPRKRTHAHSRRPDAGFGRSGGGRDNSKYVKYSLSSVDASGQYRGLRGDKLNSAVALDFLADLRARKAQSTESDPAPDSDSCKFIPAEKRGGGEESSDVIPVKRSNGRFVMPEFQFGSTARVRHSGPARRGASLNISTESEPASPDEPEDTSGLHSGSSVSGLQIRLSHLDDDDDDDSEEANC